MEMPASLETTGLYLISAGTGIGLSSGSTIRAGSDSCVSWERTPEYDAVDASNA